MSDRTSRYIERIRGAVGEEWIPLSEGVVRGDAEAEARLIELLLRGDERATTLFSLLFYDFLVEDCRAFLGDVHLAEDAAIEAVVYLLEVSLQRFRPGERATLWTWVRGAGRLKALSIRRKRKRWQAAERSLFEVADELVATPEMCSEPIGVEENDIVVWVLGGAPLTELQRGIFRLRFLERLSTSEAAERLAISLATLFREQSKLRDAILLRAEDFCIYGVKGLKGEEHLPQSDEVSQ